MIAHLEPDILECEVKWALESITMNKASGSDGILVELFQILKDDAVKVLHSICQQIWKTQVAADGDCSHEIKRRLLLGRKTDLFQSVATAEFSKFVGILSAALSQHHLSGFVIAQLEFHHLH